MSKEYRRTTEDDGTVTESCFEDGELHCETGPAVTIRKPNGSITEKFYYHGQLCRPPILTAVIVERDEGADMTTEHYAVSGEVVCISTHFGPRSELRNPQSLRRNEIPNP